MLQGAPMEDPAAAAAAEAAAAEAAAAAKVPSAWAPAEAALSAKAAASAATAAQLEKAGQDLATLKVQPKPAVEKPIPVERMNFDELYASVLPPRETAQRVEECRRRLEWVVQKKWRDASVAVYGSAGSGLSLGSVSDIDLCVHLPAILRAKNQTAAATAALDAAKAEAPATAALLDELSRAQAEVARVKQLLGRANAERNPANAASLDRRLAAASATVTALTEEISNSDEHRSVINTLQPLDVEVKRLARAQIDDKRLVYMLANALRASGYKNVEPIAHARTPVIKCVYGATDLDVVVNNGLAVHNTALLRAYLDVADYTRQFIVLVKLWASRRGVNKAAEGTLSSYGHVLSAIHFLQAGVDPPMLPDLQDPSLVLNLPPRVYDGIDCRFGDPRSWTPRGDSGRFRGCPSSSSATSSTCCAMGCRAASTRSQCAGAAAASRASCCARRRRGPPPTPTSSRRSATASRLRTRSRRTTRPTPTAATTSHGRSPLRRARPLASSPSGSGRATSSRTGRVASKLAYRSRGSSRVHGSHLL